MPILPAFLLMAHAAQTGTVEVPLHYRRPSAALAEMKGLSAKLIAFDARGTVGVSGSPADVEKASRVLRLFDVPRKPLLVRVTVASPVDHLTWEVDARLASGQRWRTADDETGSEVSLQPRVDADGALVVLVVARCRDSKLTSSLRLAKGGSRTLEFGATDVEYIELGPKDEVKVKTGKMARPSITVRYVGG